MTTVFYLYKICCYKVAFVKVGFMFCIFTVTYYSNTLFHINMICPKQWCYYVGIFVEIVTESNKKHKMVQLQCIDFFWRVAISTIHLHICNVIKFKKQMHTHILDWTCASVWLYRNKFTMQYVSVCVWKCSMCLYVCENKYLFIVTT